MTKVRTPTTTTHLRWVLGLTSTAYFMVVLDSLVVITALPQMQRDLHADLASLARSVHQNAGYGAAGCWSCATLVKLLSRIYTVDGRFANARYCQAFGNWRAFSWVVAASVTGA